VMAGWDSLAGALTPLVGAAPTNSGFIATDYDRGGIGITGDGTSYLNSNRANNADPQNDKHISIYLTGSLDIASFPIGDSTNTGRSDIYFSTSDTTIRINGSGGLAVRPNPTSGLVAGTRSASDSFDTIVSGTVASQAGVSETPSSNNIAVFARNNSGTVDGVTTSTLAFYSIGSATDLALLDARVSTLMADLRAIEETGFDRDALAYIRAVEEADGAYLETDVKVAINNLVSGLKAEGLWESMASTCLLCGPRTLAGALVPLRGDAPTAYGGWASGDYDRATGLTGDPTASLYLDSNFPADSTDDDDHHIAVYVANGDPSSHVDIGYSGVTSYSQILSNASNNLILYYLGRNSIAYSPSGTGQGDTTGLIGLTSDSGSSFDFRFNQTTGTATASASQSLETLNYFVFARNNIETPDVYSQSKLSFYSAGSSLDLAKLDTHVSAYVTAIGAAI